MKRIIRGMIAVAVVMIGGISGLESQLKIVMAKEEAKQELIRRIPIADGDVDNFVPDEFYEPEAGGVRYHLESWRPVNDTVASHQTQEEVEILFSDTEWVDRIPEVKEVIVSDEETGMQKSVALPLLYTEYSDSMWKDGFTFPVKVESWDADFFALGEILIPKKEEEPFAGYEEQLLTQIGVDLAFYKIRKTEWVGPAYEKNGVWFREAIAEGEKLVADVTAVYGGTITWEETQNPAVEAVYHVITVDMAYSHPVQDAVGENRIKRKCRGPIWEHGFAMY